MAALFCLRDQSAGGHGGDCVRTDNIHGSTTTGHFRASSLCTQITLARSHVSSDFLVVTDAVLSWHVHCLIKLRSVALLLLWVISVSSALFVQKHADLETFLFLLANDRSQFLGEETWSKIAKSHCQISTDSFLPTGNLSPKSWSSRKLTEWMPLRHGL